MVEETVGRKKLMKKLKTSQAKNADARARKDVKPRKGTFADRVKDAAKKAPEKRGLPARVEKTRGNANKANPPKEIRLKGEGGTGRAVKDVRFKPIPLGDRPKALPAPKAAPRTFNPGAAAGRLLGPAGFLVGMTTPAGSPEESSTIRRDRSYGPLMRGNASRAQTVDRSGKGDRESSVNRETKTDRTPPKPKARPSSAPKPKAKPERKAQSGAKKPTAQRVAFRGNWIGAKPTEMQARGGRRIKRANLLDFLKNR